MTAKQFGLLALLALLLTAIGAALWFDPPPVQSTFGEPAVADAVLSSSASTGFGLLLPQIAIAAPGGNPGGSGPILILLNASRTSTPTSWAPTVTWTPVLTDTATPSITDTLEPSLTPAPTQTSGPSLTPAPTRTPLLTVLAGCGDISDPGNYTLGTSLSSTGDCLNIRSHNVTLDCRGQSITGSKYAGYGIFIHDVGFIPQRANNVEIRNCNVSGFIYGIYVEGATNLYVHDNVSSNNFSDVDGRRYGIFLGMAEAGGIRVNNTQTGRVDNNTTNNEAIGIDVRGSTDVKVRGNQSSNNTAWGVDLWGTNSSEVSGNTSSGNIRYCTWGAGVVGPGCDAGGIILQYGSNGNLIANNQIGSGNGNGIFIKAHAMPCGSNNVISGNTIRDFLYNGIELGFCKGNQVVSNTISNGLDGVWLGFSVNTTIKDNTIQNMNNHGIISNNSHDNVISNNNLVNDNEALYFYWLQVDQNQFGWIDINQYHSFNNCLCGNTLTGNLRTGIHLLNSTGNQITDNTLSGNGRNYWLEGSSGGNNISGNNPNTWLPNPLSFPQLLALR